MRVGTLAPECLAIARRIDQEPMTSELPRDSFFKVTPIEAVPVVDGPEPVARGTSAC